MSTDEHNLIRAACDGDTRAFTTLVKRCDRRVMAVLSGMFTDPEDVLDAYQEAFISAYRGLSRFKFDCSFTTWIYRIAVNTGLDFKRKSARRDRIMEQIPPEDLSPRPTPQTDRLALNQELGNRIALALNTLSARERMAFVLCHEQGFRLSEASDLMACSTGSIKSYLYRAREKMKVQLADLNR